MKIIERISKKWQRISLTDKKHEPVMCKEIIQYLKPQNKKWILDCTLGLGGHAQELLKNMPPDSGYIGVDKDEESLSLARERLEDFQDQLHLFHSDFKHVDKILEHMNLKTVDGVLFDLGTSFYQLSYFERGFSFLREGPLDMRMDRTSSISAYDLVNHLSEKELDYIFKAYGQERWHSKIAHCIVEERKNYPIATTIKLAELIVRTLGQKPEGLRIHPATRIFQALRIAVNQEFEALRVGLEKILNRLSKGGRACVITFHSLEDRIVKETFKKFKAEGSFNILTSKPIRPSSWELRFNPKARSAKLRAIERI